MWIEGQDNFPAVDNQVGRCTEFKTLNDRPACGNKIVEGVEEVKLNYFVIFIIGLFFFFFQIVALALAVTLGINIHKTNKENLQNHQNLMRQY